MVSQKISLIKNNDGTVSIILSLDKRQLDFYKLNTSDREQPRELFKVFVQEKV